MQKLLAFILLLGFMSSSIQAQEKQNISDIILKYATTGNFASLKDLKSLSLKKDEAMMLNALLEKDGKVARAIYKRFLDLYPNSKLTSLSRSRLMEYQSAVNESQDTLVPSPVSHEPVEIVPEVRYTLQFGSFISEENALRFSKKFPSNLKTAIIPFIDDYGQKTFKVRWKGYKTSRAEIDQLAESLPFDSFVVEYK